MSAIKLRCYCTKVLNCSLSCFLVSFCLNLLLLQEIRIMIRHIVFFRISEQAEAFNRDELLIQVKEELGKLPALIPDIISFEVGINSAVARGTADLSLLSVFSSFESLAAYQNHPAHRAFVEWNRKRCPKIAVVDYEILPPEVAG